jgi:hypothetical protein
VRKDPAARRAEKHAPPSGRLSGVVMMMVVVMMTGRGKSAG